MSWDVDYENEDSIALAHEDGFVLFAKQGMDQGDHTNWTLELTHTETHRSSTERHLWSVVETDTDPYPPRDDSRPRDILASRSTERAFVSHARCAPLGFELQPSVRPRSLERSDCGGSGAARVPKSRCV